MQILNRQRETDDRILVQKAQEGSREAFGQLVARHHQVVRCFLSRYLGNPDDVDEVAQEVFMCALDGVVRFKKKSSFRTWLLAIAKNKALSCLRDAQKLPIPADRIEQLIVEGQIDEGVHTDEPDDQFTALQLCLGQLSVGHRELIQQIYFEGQRPADIAGKVGKARNAIRMRLMRIRKALSSCINKRTAK